MKNELRVLGACGAIFALVACGSDDSSSSSDGGADGHVGDATNDVTMSMDSSTDASTSPDGAGDTGTNDTGIADSNMDVGEASQFPLNGCLLATFVDRTAAGAARTITGPATLTPSQWSPPCMRIKAGQSVTWNVAATFALHPLEAAGGDSNTPIATPAGALTTITYAFPNAGLFGFDCGLHPFIMQGAILVDP